ncbi:MAG: alcohol dehydrogenase catalytic domain-containing protein [Candidatus Eremiobacteraeota bacterium]|nr:alcohol dehydrogenase catalytic domain-containing protein [Candidatus Eremiobacteraeota bacterium]MBV8365668.1 alcohol dehydrogenase catalytic domain-containing protein [Candidatus Eremiobacteraeota bacterium]
MPSPQPGPGELLVRVRAALTCGTDLKTYRRGHPKLQFGPFGHEASGDVVAVGRDVKGFKPGDAVMWVQTAPCMQCDACVSGSENLCERIFDEIALGAYADYIVLPRAIVRRNVFRKPVGLSYIEAAFLEPLSCVVHGWNVLRRANAQRPLPPNVAIIGAGTIGMLHLLYAKHAGVRATMIARSAQRIELAQALGAHETIDARELEKAAVWPRFAAVIECAGMFETWRQALALTRPGGRTLFFSGLPSGSEVPLDATRIHYEEIACLGAFHFTPDDVRETRDLLVAGRIAVRPLVSAVVALANLSDVFERLDRRQGYKYALIPEPGAAEWV